MNEMAAGPASHEAQALADRILAHIRYTLGRTQAECAGADLFRAVALPIRERLIDGLIRTETRYRAAPAKRVYLLSSEYLMGPLLRHHLVTLGLLDTVRAACDHVGVDLETVFGAEPDPALGNGGLGRMAACMLESMAALSMPAFGYGLNYQFGAFRQVIEDGAQHECPERWEPHDSPWLVERADEACLVPVYGRIEAVAGDQPRPAWTDYDVLVGIPHVMPIVGTAGQTVNWLRLYSARASDRLDLRVASPGDYVQAVERKIGSENVSKILYPPEPPTSGRELRFQQEYFLVACALRDILRRLDRDGQPIERLPDLVAIQLNETHTSLAVAEMMRLLVDERGLAWDRAWELARATCGYTIHSLLAESLEKWSVALFERVLPRHLQIVYEINYRFLQEVRKRWVGDEARVQRLSLVEEFPERQVRMAHVAIVGSHAVNGVARLHAEQVKRAVAADFHELWPERFQGKTNGVNHRRWLVNANPALAALITDCIGPRWVNETDRLRDFAGHADDRSAQARFGAIKRENKAALARLARTAAGVPIDPDSLFDVHVKRIQAYKRQLMNALHLVHRYLQIVEDGAWPDVPRTAIFAGKAAPGHAMARLIIQLIHGVAEVVNGDPRVSGALKIVFLPDYRVSLAERIVPAADLSEQISTAGTEASGTGIMKLAMNGAVTIGTLDGATIEICEAVGEQNIYIFGLRASEVQALREGGAYSPWDHYRGSDTVRRAMDAICGNRFCPSQPGLFRPLHDGILYGGDPYMILPDFEPYLAAQDRVAADVRDAASWRRKAMLNVAAMAGFSMDRTVREYARDIWGVTPVTARGADLA